MHANAKVALALLGMLVGGVAGYLTTPIPVEIVRIGEQPGQAPGTVEPVPPLPMPMRSAVRPEGLMAQQGGRVLIFAAGGGVIGLLVGFATGRL